jgi:rod shape-determining protein MreD
VIFLSFLAAGFLMMVPLPDWMEAWRPAWVTLFLIYWVMALPHRVGLLFAWTVGFFMDALEGTLLGLNAVSLALVAYLAMSLYQRLRMFTPLQQSSTVMILVGIHQLLLFWVLTITGQSTAPNLMFLLSAVSSAIVWPFVFVTLRYLRRNFRVS